MKTIKSINFVVVLMLVAMAMTLFAATNYRNEGDVVNLTWSSTSPVAGAAVVKGTAKATGAIVGVALNGSGVVSESVTVATKGVFDLPVTASSTIGNMAIGDYVYTSVSGINTSTAVLSNDNSGILFGQTLRAVVASTTAGVYTTAPVMIRQPGHL